MRTTLFDSAEAGILFIYLSGACLQAQVESMGGMAQGPRQWVHDELRGKRGQWLAFNTVIWV